VAEAEARHTVHVTQGITAHIITTHITAQTQGR